MRWFLALVTAGLLCAAAARAQEAASFERQLTTDGVVLEIHGASPALDLFAVTYRSPTNFFEFEHMSLVTRDPALLNQLRGVKRHDRVRIIGSLLPNPSAQKHILATSIELVRPYTPSVTVPAYEYQSSLPRDLLDKTSASFLVHIAQPDDGILVVEYRDAVLPVFVTNKALLRNLSRNDVIQLAFRVRSYPDRPIHLEVDEDVPEPLRVLESIAAKHGRPADLEGALVLFPQSPQITTNVFAVLEELPGGLTRQYTLLNTESEERFAAIRDTLQAAWNRHAAAGDYVNGRNKLVNLKVRVRARGTFNQVDPGQANPQIVLDSADFLTFDERD